MIDGLYEELVSKLPELKAHTADCDRDNPALLFDALVQWLRTSPSRPYPPPIVARLMAFHKWCLQQPRGAVAGEDLLTILVVSFYEPLFEAEETRRLLPLLISRENVTQNAEYLKRWVGQENYEKAKQHFPPPGSSHVRRGRRGGG